MTNDLPRRYAEALDQHYLDPGRTDFCVCGRTCGVMSEGRNAHLAGVVLAVRDEELAGALRRAEQAEAALARVRALAELWRYAADRRTGPRRELLVALLGPAGGEQTGDGDA